MAKTTANCLWEYFIQHYCFPARLHIDQGRNCLLKIIVELWKVLPERSVYNGQWLLVYFHTHLLTVLRKDNQYKLVQKEIGHKPTKKKTSLESEGIRKYLRDWDKFTLKDKILYRYSNLYSKKVSQLVLPPVYRDVVFQGLHDTHLLTVLRKDNQYKLVQKDMKT
jgi:hypothetical protein